MTTESLQTRTRETGQIGMQTGTTSGTRAVRLPPAGPVWFSSVMGTGILATLLGREVASAPVLLVPAALLTCAAALLLVGLVAGFTVRVARHRIALTSTLSDSSIVPTWGTVSMGILSVGSAVLTVVPQVGARTTQGGPATWVVAVDATCWVLGTVLGVVTAFGFAGILVKKDVGHPVPAWGLPIVPPMVSATTGAALVPHLHTVTGRLTLLTAIAGCFFLALFLGALVFALAYHHHWRVAALPVPASASAWIPLGVVGQSMAAAQAMAAQSATLLGSSTGEAANRLADAYGYVMLVVSVPVIAYALAMTIRGFRARMPFSPGWWALTFPLGTLALGTRLLGVRSGHAPIAAIGIAALATLCCTWLLCTVATLSALRRARGWTAEH